MTAAIETAARDIIARSKTAIIGAGGSDDLNKLLQDTGKFVEAIAGRVREMRNAIDMIEGALMGWPELLDLPESCSLDESDSAELELQVTITWGRLRRLLTSLEDCTRIINSDDYTIEALSAAPAPQSQVDALLKLLAEAHGVSDADAVDLAIERKLIARSSIGLFLTEAGQEFLRNAPASPRAERFCPGCNKSLTELSEVGCSHDDCPFPRALGERPVLAAPEAKR